MTAWLTIKAADLEDYQVSALVEALRSAALGSNQADPFDAIAADRIAYIRNRIAGRVSLSGTASTVPPELKTCACWLILEAMLSRLSMDPEQQQERMISRAYKDLDIAGTPSFPITAPDDAAPEADVQSGGSISVVTSPYNQPTRHSMDGL